MKILCISHAFVNIDFTYKTFLQTFNKNQNKKQIKTKFYAADGEVVVVWVQEDVAGEFE